MAAFPLINIPVYLGAYDLSSHTNEVRMADIQAVVLNRTSFASGGWEEVRGGLKSAKLMIKGFLDTSTSEVAMNAYLGVSGVPMAALPASVQNGVAGDPAVFAKAKIDKVAMMGKVGDLAPIQADLTASGSDPVVDGFCLQHMKAVTATANGTGVQMGAVSSVQKMYASLFVSAASGTTPTLDIVVQSAATNTFAGAVTRMTFATATGASYQVGVPFAAAVTDSWWRIVSTIGGTTPSFTFAVVAGIA